MSNGYTDSQVSLWIPSARRASEGPRGRVRFGVRGRTGPIRLVSSLKRATNLDPFLQAAIDEAKQGLAEGGIPIGSVLVIDGRIVGRGHNRRVQKKSAILHAEMDCLENAGRLRAADYRRSVLYSTLSPCWMCSGTALLYRIPKIVIGEDQT